MIRQYGGGVCSFGEDGSDVTGRLQIEEIVDVVEEAASVGAEEIRQIFPTLIVAGVRFAGVRRLRSKDVSIEVGKVDLEIGLQQVR